MSSRLEEILNATVNGETIEFTPQSRMEEYLKACVNKSGTDGLPQPVSRSDALFYKLAENLDTSDATATAEDIRSGKTAYVAGKKVTGTAERSLKKLLDTRRSTSDLFCGIEMSDYSSIINYDDTENVTDMSYMFLLTGSKLEISIDSYNDVLVRAPNLNTSKVTNMSYMFGYCSKLKTVPTYDTSKVTDMSYMFVTCSSLVSAPNLNTSKVTNMSRMFESCYVLKTVPTYDTSKVTDMSYMFSTCKALTTVPRFDTSNVTNMSRMFKSCLSLVSAPNLNTSKVTNMDYMFEACSKLKTVPTYDTSNVTRMAYMFSACKALTTVPGFDMVAVSTASGMFSNCSALTTIGIKNIKTSISVGSGMTYGHLLTEESLIHLLRELRKTTATKTLTIGSANIAKLTNLYVRTIDITDEMRAEDDLIDEKLPFEVCESTDEGATFYQDYLSEKLWKVQ